MSKRDYVAEITSRRNRLRRRTKRYDEMSNRLDGIIDIANFIHDSNARDVPFRKELAKYIPIGTVACIEGYFRLVFRDLIDHGSPFRENVAKFKDIRLGVDHVIALQSRKVTFGEFVAHLLPASSLEDLHASISVLIGEPFLDRLKSTKAEFFETGEFVSLNDEGMSDAVIRDVKALFEQRHIFAHELATKIRFDPRSIAVDYAAGTIFMVATEALVAEVLASSP